MLAQRAFPMLNCGFISHDAVRPVITPASRQVGMLWQASAYRDKIEATYACSTGIPDVKLWVYIRNVTHNAGYKPTV